MKKSLLCFWSLLMAVTFTVQSQVPKEPKLLPGSSITWNLSLGYAFKVNIQDLKPEFIFDWNSGQHYGRGIIKPQALKEATTLINYFSEEDTVTYTNATTILISDAIYKKLKEGKTVNIISNDTLQKLTFVKKETMNVSIDGKEVPLDVLYAETDIHHKYWIWDNAETPLVLKMDIGWTLDISAIVTKE